MFCSDYPAVDQRSCCVCFDGATPALFLEPLVSAIVDHTSYSASYTEARCMMDLLNKCVGLLTVRMCAKGPSKVSVGVAYCA